MTKRIHELSYRERFPSIEIAEWLRTSWDRFIDAYGAAVHEWNEHERVGEDEYAMHCATEEHLRDWMDDIAHRVGIDTTQVMAPLAAYIEQRGAGEAAHLP